MHFGKPLRPGLVLILGLVLAASLSWPLTSGRTADENAPSDVPVGAPAGAPTPGGVAASGKANQSGYAGSPSCKSCHERFYGLWSTSRHGQAMRPYSDELAASILAPQTEDLAVGAFRYRAFVGPGQGFVREYGPEGERDYPMRQVLGGKNVCYFLTPLDRGRLQTLPVAYDRNGKRWYDTAASGLRHGPASAGQSQGQGQGAGQGQGQGAGQAQGEKQDAGAHPDWRDSAYTFNTSCYNCHVSQMETNYDPATDSYATTWLEPGINCETCHGPSAEHNAVCAAAPKGTVPGDLKILRIGKDLTVEQRNDDCATCHAKMAPITASYSPGQKFFDHFDLVLLDNPDYYPDGRDLGENFTFTSWMSSPCARSGRLDCIFCHTSSGRFKQASDPDKACLPCHQDKAAGQDKHTRHKAESPASRCISCHMPKTVFAGMARSDHSMLPPAPAATAAFGSPNACQACHKDKSPDWADKTVRAWRSRDYQAPVLERGHLIEQARRRDFSSLDRMVAYLARPDRDPVFAASLARLLRACPEGLKWPALLGALGDSSPLVRASAASSLAESRDPRVTTALAKACADESRLVRVRAAEALAGVSLQGVSDAGVAAVEKAVEELKASFAARPDDWAGSYNLGNYLLRTREPVLALEAYEKAMRLRPDAFAPMMNAAMAKARLGDMAGAEALLRKAQANDPRSAAAAFNLGLALAERGRPDEARAWLGKALSLDPGMAEAAYNLGLLTLKSDPALAEVHLRQAVALQPGNARYVAALRHLETWSKTPANQKADALAGQGSSGAGGQGAAGSKGR